MQILTAIPVYNEVNHIESVLDRVLKVASDVLVVNDGSTDGTTEILDRRADVMSVHHVSNRGYGAALRTAFEFALDRQYDLVVTLDADGQHDPKLIREFVSASANWDIVSGTRYLTEFSQNSDAPTDRQTINRLITHELNQQFGLELTDSFCGFKAYRVGALSRLTLTEDGYAMPLELWVQASQLGFRICEVPVPRIYLDAERTFGGTLDDPDRRLAHYRHVIRRSEAQAPTRARAWACDELSCLWHDPMLAQES